MRHLAWLDLALSQHPTGEKFYYYSYPKTNYIDVDPLQASINAVNDIVKNYPAPYTLLCSGGVDSQAMLWAWEKSGNPYKVVSFEQVNDDGEVFNDHDLETLRLFANYHDIPVEYLQFNTFDFLKNELVNYALKYECPSPHLTAFMRMSESINCGTVILSGNYATKPILPLNYVQLGLTRYVESTGRSMIPFFFLHSAELALSFIQNYEWATRNIKMYYYENLAHFFSYLKKYYTYMYSGFPVIPQPQKYSGFEKIKDYYDQQMDKVTMVQRIKYGKKPSKRVFDLLYRYPLEDMFSYERELIRRPEKEGSNQLTRNDAAIATSATKKTRKPIAPI